MPPRSRLVLALVAALAGVVTATPAHAATLHVRAGAPAGGTGTAAAPFASLEAVQRASRPGDTIVVDQGPTPLDGGLALQPGQRLEGRGPRSVLTNTDAARLDGDAIRLATGTTVANLVVRGAA